MMMRWLEVERYMSFAITEPSHEWRIFRGTISYLKEWCPAWYWSVNSLYLDIWTLLLHYAVGTIDCPFRSSGETRYRHSTNDVMIRPAARWAAKDIIWSIGTIFCLIHDTKARCSHTQIGTESEMKMANICWSKNFVSDSGWPKSVSVQFCPKICAESFGFGRKINPCRKSVFLPKESILTKKDIILQKSFSISNESGDFFSRNSPFRQKKALLVILVFL